MDAEPGRRIGPWLLAAACYAVLACALTWPLVAHLSDVLPHDLGDPVLNTWILWWNAHVLPLTRAWWNAPMFWPAEGALALSEHLLGLSVFTTPMQWLGASPVAAYNVMFVASFVLSALGAHALVFTLTGRHDAAAIGGVVFGFNPYRIAQAPHLQVLASWWMPVALLALHAYLRRRDRRWLWLFGTAWLLQALSNGYYLLFFPVLLALWAGWFLPWRTDRRAVMAVAAAWALASLPLAAVLWKYRQIHAAFHLQRGGYEIDVFSADVVSLTDTSPLVQFWSWLSAFHKAEGELFPGWAAVVLIAIAGGAWLRRAPRAARSSKPTAVFLVVAVALAGIALCAMRFGPWSIGVAGFKLLSVGDPSKPLSLGVLAFVLALVFEPRIAAGFAARSVPMFYAAAAAVMYLLSFGPRPRFLDAVFMYQAPYAWLMALPGFDSIRVPARFAMLAVLCLSVAAGLAFARLTAGSARRRRAAFAAAVLAVAAADGWVTAIPLRPAPARLGILETLPGQTPILELPLGDTERDAAAVLRSAYHRHPVVNGYSGFSPPHYDVLHLALEAIDASAIDDISASAPIVALVDTGEYQGELWASALSARKGVTVLGRDGPRVVFSIPASGMHLPAQVGRRLPVQSASANVMPGDAALMIDGDLASRWSTGAAQSGTEAITLDLGSVQAVNAVALSLGVFAIDFPRLLAVDVSEDGRVWAERWKGPTVGPALAALLRNVPGAPIVVSWPPSRAHFVRLRQLTADPRYYWSVAEVAVFGQ